ncbi:MAG: ABC transporter permease [Promethearchaeota archaeon]
MGIIIKKAIKDFKNLGWRSYLIVFTIILSLGGGLGLYYGIRVAVPMMDLYYDEVNHADYTYQLSEDTWITQNQLDGLDDINQVDEYTGRLIWTTSTQLKGQEDRKYIILIGLDYNRKNDGHPDVYDYTIRKGDNFDPKDNNISAVIDETFANANNLKVKDKLMIDGLNDAELKIFGLCNAPEFIMTTSNPEFLFPIEGSMAVIYLSKDTLKNYIIRYYTEYNWTVSEDLSTQILYFKNIDYNNLAVTFKDDIIKGNEEVKNYLRDEGINIEKTEAFEDSYAYTLMKADVSDTGEIMMIMLYFMALLGAIIVYVIFNRYVYNQKQQIGIMLGLGYTKKDIMRYFMFIILLIFILAVPAGIVVGYGLGYIMMGEMMGEMAHVEAFAFPFLFLPEVLYLGLNVGFMMVFFSTYFTVRKIRKKVISELIYEQEEISQDIKKPKISEEPKSITNKLVIKNLFRNKKRLAFTMIAMTFSLLIVSSSESLMDSMYYNVNKTFKTDGSQIEVSENWDLNVNFQTMVNTSVPNNLLEQIEDIKGVGEIAPYTSGLATTVGESEDLNLIVQGINLKDSKIHRFNWQDPNRDNSAPDKDNEIAISSVHATKLNKGLGDKIEIENAAGAIREFKIVGIHSELVMTVYITLEAGQMFLHNHTNIIDGLYVVVDNGEDKNKITESIYDLGNIEIIFDSEIMNEKAIEFIQTYATVMRIISLYTFIVSFFIVFYNSVMNIYDKNYEWGIMRSLGYSKKHIFKSILLENYIQGIFPIIFAIIFTFPLTEKMAQIYAENFPLTAIVGVTAILMITIPPIILYTLGSFIGLRTVYKQDLYEMVQTRFVG